MMNQQLTFFANKWQAPCENIHEIWQPIGMRRAVELSDIHHIGFILQYRGLIVVNIKVVGCGEDSH